MAKNKQSKKVVKPFFLEDSEGNLYKTTALHDEDIPLEEEEPAMQSTEDEGEEDLVTVALSAEDFEILKQLIAEKKETHDADEEKAEKPEEKKEEEEDKEVVDTCSGKDSLKGFGSIESTSNTTVTDAIDVQNEIAAAWSTRYKKN